MKTSKKYAICFIVTVLSVMLSAATCFAEDYKYTITIYSGNYGVFIDDNGNETDTLTIEVGRRDSVTAAVTLSEKNIRVTNDKYHVRSSNGNVTLMRAGQQTYITAIDVKGDAEYVVTYGVDGEKVAYTVYYLDESGNEVWPAETFYGVVGEEAVVAYRYVSEYLPQAYNLEKTLREDSEENVFTFIYHKTRIITNTVDLVTDNGVTVITGSTSETSQTDETGSGEQTDYTDEQLPEEIINIDDEMTPEGAATRGNIRAETEDGKNDITRNIPVITSGLCLIWLLLLALLLKRKDKKEN